MNVLSLSAGAESYDALGITSWFDLIPELEIIYRCT